MKKVKVAVIGYGFLGKWHVEKVCALNEKAELVAIVENFEPNKIIAQQKYPNVEIVSKIEDVIDKIDAVVIVTPTSSHFDLVKYLLENRKHVFCEKPVCENDQQARSLLDLAGRFSNQIIQIGHSERFHECWDLLKTEFEKISADNFSMRIIRNSVFKSRATDVSVVSDLMIHDIDLVLYLTKRKIKKIKASGLKNVSSKIDSSSVLAVLDNNCHVYLESNRNNTIEERSICISSTDGTLDIDLLNRKINCTYNDKFKNFEYEKRDHLLIEHSYFYKSILNQLAPIVTLQDGCNAVEIIEAIEKSIKENREVVL